MLEIKDIYVNYGDSQVLNGISLEVEKGALVSIVGRNGVGKTTLMHSIIGFAPSRKGSIILNGQDITHSSIEDIARAGISIVPQGRRIFPSLTVEEHLLVAAKIMRYRENDRDTRFNLERIYSLFPNLAGRRKNRGNELSGGEQQMLAIGRALISNPHIIMMDEPTEGLAPIMVDTITNTIAEIMATGLSVLLVEQSLDTAVVLSKTIYVMSKGQIVHSSAPQAFLENDDVISTYLGVGKTVNER